MGEIYLECNAEGIKISANITEDMVNFLRYNGYYEGDFDFDEYVDITDAFESGQYDYPIMLSLVEYYEDVVLDYGDKVDNGEVRDEDWDCLSEYEKLADRIELGIFSDNIDVEFFEY